MQSSWCSCWSSSKKFGRGALVRSLWFMSKKIQNDCIRTVFRSLTARLRGGASWNIDLCRHRNVAPRFCLTRQQSVQNLHRCLQSYDTTGVICADFTDIFDIYFYNVLHACHNKNISQLSSSIHLTSNQQTPTRELTSPLTRTTILFEIFRDSSVEIASYIYLITMIVKFHGCVHLFGRDLRVNAVRVGVVVVLASLKGERCKRVQSSPTTAPCE
jgi:hypothetical protein